MTETATSYVKNSEHFTQILDTITIDDTDILASFDVKSLYPSIPVDEALQQISTNEDLPDHIIELSRHCLNNAYFMFDGQIYRQTDGAAMGSSLSPAIANLFMIYFEKNALETANKKPKLWLRYVDDIFVVWPHDQQELLQFLDHLNSQHQRIQFTVEVEENNQLPFLDVLIMKTQHGRLEHTVYRKPTHTNRYLHGNSHHHPSQIQGVADTLITRSTRLTSHVHKQKELQIIKTALNQNGYSSRTINKAIEKQLHPRPHTQKQENEEKPKAILPYIKGTTDRIGRILRRNNIATSYKPHQTIRSLLKNPKDKIKLENQGVYSIACATCNQTYVGQTNRRISTRVEEHKLAIRNKQTTSALFEHEHSTGHKINFESCKQIANISNYRTRIIRESIEIEKLGQLNKRDDSLNLPMAWKTIIQKKPPDAPSTTAQTRLPATDPTEGAGQDRTEAEPTNRHRYNLRRRV